MRRFSLFVLVLLVLLIPVTLLQANSGGGGSSPSSGASHASSGGGYSGGGASGNRSSYSIASPNASSHTTPATHSSNVRDARGANGTDSVGKARVPLPTTKTASQPEKKSFFSFLRHPPKKEETPAANFRQPFCHQRPCPARCPGGGVRGFGGACPVIANTCLPGQFGNGSCGFYWSNGCSALAGQLEAQRRQMQGGSDPGQSLIYRLLRDRYQQCMQRYGFASFGYYAPYDALLFDIP